jgi:hypothetical protein
MLVDSIRSVHLRLCIFSVEPFALKGRFSKVELTLAWAVHNALMQPIAGSDVFQSATSGFLYSIYPFSVAIISNDTSRQRSTPYWSRFCEGVCGGAKWMLPFSSTGISRCQRHSSLEQLGVRTMSFLFCPIICSCSAERSCQTPARRYNTTETARDDKYMSLPLFLF